MPNQGSDLLPPLLPLHFILPQPRGGDSALQSCSVAPWTLSLQPQHGDVPQSLNRLSQAQATDVSTSTNAPPSHTVDSKGAAKYWSFISREYRAPLLHQQYAPSAPAPPSRPLHKNTS